MIKLSTAGTFQKVWDDMVTAMRLAPIVKTERWQGVEANQETRELRNAIFGIIMDTEDLDYWRRDIRPNLPWADDHFMERVSGHPLNPGEQWKNWPWSNPANAFRKQGRFNHSYMERLWPKYARRTDDGILPIRGTSSLPRGYPRGDIRSKFGIGHGYGDLQDLVNLLANEPYTRQAWIPLFFPEDTGRGDSGRKPCTLGYQFTVRDGRLNVFYPMRSCDLRRHFRDDCYLAVRLLLWILDRCRELRPEFWDNVVPGDYSMWVTSLHIFATDKVEDL